jgi:hypothetical protein
MPPQDPAAPYKWLGAVFVIVGLAFLIFMVVSPTFNVKVSENPILMASIVAIIMGGGVGWLGGKAQTEGGGETTLGQPGGQTKVKFKFQAAGGIAAAVIFFVLTLFAPAIIEKLNPKKPTVSAPVLRNPPVLKRVASN